MRLFFIITGVSLFFTVLSARIQLEGVILDGQSRKPLEAVIIRAASAAVVFSDSLGHFVLQVPDYPLTLSFEKPNYWTDSLLVLSPTSIRIYMEPVHYSFGTIDVRGFYSVSPSPEFHLKPEIITQQESRRSVTAAQILESLPGMYIKSYGGPAGISTLSLQGGQGDRISTMIDGIPINNEQNGGADISQIPSALLESVDFYPYGSSAVAGSSAMTGVVNLKLQKSTLKFAHTSGSNNQQKNTLYLGREKDKSGYGVILGSYYFAGEIDYKEDGSYLETYEGQEFTDHQNKLNQNYLYGWIKGRLGKKLYYNLSALSSENDRYLDGPIYSPPYASEMQDGLGILSATLGSRSWQFTSAVKNSRINYTKAAGAGPPIDSESDLTTFNTWFQWRRGVHHYQFNYAIIQNLSRNVSMNIPSVIDTSRSFIAPSYGYSSLWGTLKLSANLRLEMEKGKSPVFATGVTLFKALDGIWNSSALSLSRNYRKPTLNDLFWEPFGDPGLKTEYSNNVYLRNSFSYSAASASVNLFYIHYEDLIQWTPQAGAAGLWRPGNVRSGESYGYQLSFTFVQFVWLDWSLNLDRTLTRNYDTSIGNEHYGKSFLYAPEYLVNGQVSFGMDPFSFKLDYKYTSKRTRLYGDPDLTLPGYKKLSFSAVWEVCMRRFQIANILNIYNLTDVQYQTVLGYPEPGRSFSYTIEIKKKAAVP